MCSFMRLIPRVLFRSFQLRPRLSLKLSFSSMASPISAASTGIAMPLQRPQTGSNLNGKRQNQQDAQRWKKQKTKRERATKEGSSEEVLKADIQTLLSSRAGLASLDLDHRSGDTQEVPAPTEPLPEQGTEIQVEVLEISSTGDGLAIQKGSSSHQIYVVPFVVPGDIATAKVYRHIPSENHSIADFISVTKPSPLRDDTRIKCPYFAKCGGCQFQMLDYADQLRLKKKTLEKAFANFSNLDPGLIPAVGETIGSPLQYGYRTKLTPHFTGPPGFHQRRRGKAEKGRKGHEEGMGSCPDIGFMEKGRRKVMDIEDCPIGTAAVRLGMEKERERMRTEYANYSRGATILLRETTRRFEKDAEDIPQEPPSDAVRVETDSHIEVKTYITDNNAMSTEFIDNFTFTNPAGSFFQNNNSILSTFTSYIRTHIMPSSTSSSPSPSPSSSNPKIKYLIDAYSGSGLFTITLSSLFSGGSIGIDVDQKSIKSAQQNAALNNLPASQCSFIAADAQQLFGQVSYDPEETVVVLDPPRKGCDADFLGQLLRFGPKRVVYVSCNVHTQARDVGALVRGDGGNGTRYNIESLVGFDFFPQTAHVEGVAVLNRAE
jgi:tRNA (uracil-5-)-methyltransferase